MIAIRISTMAKADSGSSGTSAKITAYQAELEKIMADSAALKAGYAGRYRQFTLTKEKMAAAIKKAQATLKTDAARDAADLEDTIGKELKSIRSGFRTKEKSLDRKVAEAKRQVTLKTNRAEQTLTEDLNTIKKLEEDIEKTKRSVKDIYGKVKGIFPESSKVKTLSDTDLDTKVNKDFDQLFRQLLEKAGFEVTNAAKEKIDALSGDVEKAAAAVAKEKDILKKEEDAAIAELQEKFDAAKAELKKKLDLRKKQIGIMQKEYTAYLESESRVLEKLKANMDRGIAANNEKIEKIKGKMGK